MDRLGTVVIIGVGLIGGSIGQAIRTRGLAHRVVGLGRNTARLEEARRLNAIDEGTLDPAHALAEADVAVVCTPVDRIAQDVIMAAEHGRKDLLITDAGSTKGAIVAAVEEHLTARARFVAAHPIAGSEQSGVQAARADLFEGRTCVLTPTGYTPADRLERAKAFWTAIGCRTVVMAPESHDKALARTSHLPHAVASTLSGLIPSKLFPFVAGAYRDVTRIASADSGLWASIFLANREPLLDVIDLYQTQLDRLRAALESGDREAIQNWWDKGRRYRSKYDERAGDTGQGPE